MSRPITTATEAKHGPFDLWLLGSAMIELVRRKRTTQPIKAASAGCVFKNPADTSAGKLLDEAGFRGRRLGNMQAD